MRKTILFYTVVSLTITLLFSVSCSSIKKNKPLKIAISKDLPQEYITTYSAWINRFETEVEFFNLYPMGIDSAMNVLRQCDGLILTGGRDVFPAYYNKINDTSRCGSFDHYRDSLEFASIDKALDLKMPIVGICRGQQIFNISQGGSLIIDIPTDFDSTILHRQNGFEYTIHEVITVDETLLSVISGIKRERIISNHHQGIDILGKGLKISAYSKDHLPEAIEWHHRGEKGFLMAVQWHPERMDTMNLLSAPIAKEFLKEAKLFKEYEFARKVTSID